jgi:hypothetical protein
MVVDGPRRDEETVGDFVVCQSVTKELENLALASG